MAIPVLRRRELERFLESRKDRKVVEPSTDYTEQYELFFRNLLDYENWRNQM